MNWLKKKLNKLVDKLNSDETDDTGFSAVAPTEKPLVAAERFDNIEEFKDLLIIKMKR